MKRRKSSAILMILSIVVIGLVPATLGLNSSRIYDLFQAGRTAPYTATLIQQQNENHHLKCDEILSMHANMTTHMNENMHDSSAAFTHKHMGKMMHDCTDEDR